MRGPAWPSASRQGGAFLVMMLLLIIVLVGIAALVLDYGRVLALRVEMQNAVDAAALAGAVELNGDDGAMTRARAAARNAVLHDSRHARVRALLGDAALPDEAFAFFCIIGSRSDATYRAEGEPPVDENEITLKYCPGNHPSTAIWEASADADAHYIRVTLDPQLVEERFRVDLVFLPVLRMLGIDPMATAELTTTATAGRHFYQCRYSPMVLCDPFEGTGNFRDEMLPGQAIILRDQGGPAAAWAPGNFGFLNLAGDSGAADLTVNLADADRSGCTPPIIYTSPGETAQKTRAAINTRFDEYAAVLPQPPQDIYGNVTKPVAWPPAPNIVDYPHDSSWRVAGRFGLGDWDFEAYWNARHAGIAPPSGWSNFLRPTRHDVYLYEIANGMIPQVPLHAAGTPERRVISIAVAQCSALDIHGNTSATLMEPDGFARMFLFRRAQLPGGGELLISGEYLGWSSESEANYHVDVQLYQ